VAEPGRIVVRQDRTRRDRPRRVHFGARSEEETHALHPPIQQGTENREVEVLRSEPSYRPFHISCYSPLVRSATSDIELTELRQKDCFEHTINYRSMNSEIQKRLLRSVFALCMPMARLMLRYGITFDLFSEVAKEAFVRAAFLETDGRGRHTNVSRVAVKTGISRKEVSRLRNLIGSGETTLDQKNLDRSGPPAKVLHAWHTDPRFADSKGAPRVLEFDGSEVSFAALVRAVAGDVPPGAVRAELKKAGAILDTDAGNIVATKRYFVPGNVDEKAITSLSGILFPLMSGIDHNSDPARSSEGYIQRFAFSDSLPQI